MTDIQHRTIHTNGISMHIAEAGEGPLVVLIHGFPELWYSWRHQLPALAAAGYHAVAPDVRGCGGTDAPPEIEAYSLREMTADMAGLLDALGEEQAVVAGHDWGAPIAWHCALLYPDRFRAVAALSVPFVRRSPAPPTQMFKAIFRDKFFYMLYFQEPGVAEAEFETDVRRSLRIFMYAASGDAPRGLGLMGKPKDARLFDGMPDPGEKLPAWLSEEDLDAYTEALQRSGFRGPLNRYRNMDRDWEELAELAGAQIKQPALFIGGDRDPVLRFTPSDAMKATAPNLRKIVMLPGCGHWTQQERPAEVNRELIEFLNGL
ncbi:MAG: alpha/beta hydrolase [Dehalococcoidia bacterium]|nr:alpha/beta hydrolase [Dehalococcoidia bacterium]